MGAAAEYAVHHSEKKFSNWICRNPKLEKFTIRTESTFWKIIKMLNIGVLSMW